MTQNRPHTPRRTTPATKALYGVARNRQARADDVVVEKPLTPPSNLRKAEREIWDETVGAMSEGFFTVADRRILALYVRTVALADKLHEIIAAKPAVMYPPHGATKLNPIFAVWAKSVVTQQGLARELGLTPLARKSFTPLPETLADDNSALSQLSA